MKRLSNCELNQIVGGISISSSIINSFVRAIEVTLELGRSFGTAIRRISGKSACGVR